MSTRSRITVRTENAARNSSNSSNTGSSRVRSTAARESGSPYGSSARRSSAIGNQSSSATSTAPMKNSNNDNAARNSSTSNVIRDDQQQLMPEQSNDSDDELTLNMMNSHMQVSDDQSAHIHTGLTANVDQNLTLNSADANSTIVRNNGMPKDYVMSNDEVYKLFDTVANGILRCRLCQNVTRCFFSHMHI